MSLNIELLEQSFETVKAHNAEFSTNFYNTLFAEYPDVKPLFANANMKEQGDHLYKSLVFVVVNLRKPELLSDSLKGLGTRHVKYGTLPHHYPIVGSVLLKTFAQILGSVWTPEVRQAWVDAYGAVTKLMLEGADYPSDILDLNAKV
jgi:hemoglobin-like flavoprotein